MPLTNRLRWTERAVDEYEALVRHTKRNWPETAGEIARAIYQRAEMLQRFPFAGRVGDLVGMRELVVGRFPFVIIYEIQGESADLDGPVTVVILRVRHAATQWPPGRRP